MDNSVVNFSSIFIILSRDFPGQRKISQDFKTLKIVWDPWKETHVFTESFPSRPQLLGQYSTLTRPDVWSSRCFKLLFEVSEDFPITFLIMD